MIEELDKRQLQLLDLVLEKIKYYYKELYGTKPCYQYPLSLSRLMKLCNRSGSAVSMALRYLANTIPEGSSKKPEIYYDRVPSKRFGCKRVYRIFLRRAPGSEP